jgi:hypothetical protein
MSQIETQYLYGGPHHNVVSSAHDLIRTPRAGFTEYRWTPKTITGSESGRPARVWAHESVSDEVLEQFIASLTR